VHPGPTRGVPAVGEHDNELLAPAEDAQTAG
jgi:hypothetical protein